MNVIKQVWQVFQSTAPCEFKKQPITNESGKVVWQKAMKICRKEQGFVSPEGFVDYVQLANRRPVRVRGNREMFLNCRARSGPCGRSYEALMEPLPTRDGLLAARTLVTVESGRMQVRARNITNSSLMVYPYQKLGELLTIETSEVFDNGPGLQLFRSEAVEVHACSNAAEAKAMEDSSGAPLVLAFDLGDVSLTTEQKGKLAAFDASMHLLSAR